MYRLTIPVPALPDESGSDSLLLLQEGTMCSDQLPPP